MASWPATLPPLPLRAGYQESLGADPERSSMDAGPAKQRPALSYPALPVAWPIYLVNSAAAEILKTFYATTLAHGSLPFDHVHPRTGASFELRFISAPAITPLGVGYIATLELEIMP